MAATMSMSSVRMPTTAKMGAKPAGLKAPFMGKTVVAKTQRVARTARDTTIVAAAGQKQVEIEKPLGLTIADSKAAGGGCVVTRVTGNAAKSGIKVGDTVIYTSSFFGEELWPADKASFVRTTLNRAPSPVCFIYVNGENETFNVKRANNRPAPKRFGRKLTATQKENATHICVDCGYIYFDALPFAQLGPDYSCPQCNAGKRRFAKYDAEKGQQVGQVAGELGTLATVIGGLLGVGIVAYVGLQL